MAIAIRGAAKDSIGSVMPAKSLELKHTIHLIEVMTAEIQEVELSIKSIMDASESPIMTIPGINYRMGAMILAEVGDFSAFSSSDKVLAYAGCSPTTYQSGQLTSTCAKMEKRGSRYLQYALINAVKKVCRWGKTFRDYLSKKKAEGKHPNSAAVHTFKIGAVDLSPSDHRRVFCSGSLIFIHFGA